MPAGHYESLTSVLYILYEESFIRQEKTGDAPMKALFTALFLTLALLAGCTPGEKKAAELLETARFEEKQSNLEHAAKLYNAILKKYPSAPSAKEAAARIAELQLRKPS